LEGDNQIEKQSRGKTNKEAYWQEVEEGINIDPYLVAEKRHKKTTGDQGRPLGVTSRSFSWNHDEITISVGI